MLKEHSKKERTLVLIKPDGIQRSLIGEIINRIERIGLKLVAMKMLVIDEAQAERHYTLDAEWILKVGQKALTSYKNKGQKPPADDPLKLGEITLRKLKKYLTNHPVIVMVWEGAHAVEIVRKLVGGTEPLSSDVGTIRGDFMLDSYVMSDGDGRAVRNLLHASGTLEEATAEINLWFNKDEIMNYEIVQEKILYATSWMA